MILLDTHALVWMDADDPALGKASRRLIQQAWEGGRLTVSAVSFWECSMLQQRDRLVLPMPPSAWRENLISAGLREHPLDGAIAVLATQLALPHKDPADRFIAATAILHAATLVTADERLLAWKHPLKRQDARR
ncbi:MAG: type II toxin-antitoxin system VapC family toxin [Deferrisomatales bacterium]|nr:type II toxin-antitoxin system VapC family toxin [Deferrisomatales bacterium]